jgi:hypothetical protein
LPAVYAASMVGVHPKILNRRKMIRVTSAQGMMNLDWDSMKRSFSPPLLSNGLKIPYLIIIVAMYKHINFHFSYLANIVYDDGS